ncbi:hypothetical protein IJE86_05625 [bacterium]|nr:hypothetical protein [bacterium]
MQAKAIIPIIFVCLLCCGCNPKAIDSVNPVVQLGNVQSNTKQVTEEVKQIREYALEMQRKELEQLNLYED